jgi:two-component system, cell cycle sensor histidine kinase and response regulator CckA
MSEALRLLIVEDNPDDAELVIHALGHGGLSTTWTRVETAGELRAALADGPWDAVLSDYTLPEFNAEASLEIVRGTDPDLPFIVVSGTVGEDVAVQIMRAGASDYVLKNALTRLAPALVRELREAENRRAKRAAERSAAHLAAIVESSVDAIVSENLDGQLTSWNRGAERLYGWTADEAIGRHVSFLVPLDKLGARTAIVDQVRAGENVGCLETVRLHKDGHRIDISWTISPMRNAEGQLIGLTKTGQDIRERKRAEQALRASEARYHRLFEAAQDGILIVDVTTRRILDANPFLTKLLGYPYAELVGKELWEIGLFPDREATEAAFRTLQAQGYIRYDDRRLATNDGRRIEVEFVSNIYDAGEDQVMQCNIRDVSERKQADEALRKSEERYRTLIAATTAIVWDSPASGKFDSLQPAWTAFTGQTLAEHRGWGWLDVVHLDDREKSARAWAAAVTARSDYRMEHRLRRSDGEYRQMSVRAVPITERSGVIREWVGVHTDITEQHRAEEGLRESRERLAAALAASGSGTFRWNIVSDALEWDDQLDRLFGLPPGTTPQSLENFLAMVHPDDRAGVVGRCRKCKEQGADFAMEFRVVRPDGTVRWLDDRGQTSRGLDGRPDYMTGACVDITERKQADEALRTSVDEFRMLAESVPNIVWYTGPDSKCSYLNPQWMNYTGATLEESLGDGWIRSFHPEDRQRALDAWNDAMATGSTYAVEVRLKRADGNYRWWLARCVPHRDDAGNIIKWFGTCTDIDELKRTETERAELFAQLTLQFERMPLAYLLCGLDGRYTRWNPAAEQMFGFTEAEVLGKLPTETIVPAQSQAIVLEIFARLAAGDMNAHGTCENIMKDGRTIECEWHNTPLFNPDGEFQGILSLAQNVTARQRAEKALHLRDRAIQAATQGLLITDPKQADNPIIYVSPGFERITGYVSEEAVGRNCRFLQGADTAPAAVAQLREAIRAREPCAVELLNYRKDGTSFWNELSVSPVRNADGQLTHFVGVQSDVTARRHLEEQFRQAQKMEAFGQLAGGVAHDFNNLLTIINGYSDLLLDSLPAGDPSRSLVTEIHKAGERSAGLTRQLLAFSRQQILAPRVLNLNEVVTETDKMLRRLIGEDIRLTTTLDSALWAVQADAGQVEQVLLNLAVNARDAMSKGGRLTIETRNIELDETYTRTHSDAKAGPHVLMSVTDTGNGMSPEVQARIFEPFFTTKGLGKGTGLGLATVFGIVKQSGGHVAVYSEVGVGTSFKVYLPRIEEESEVLKAPSRVLTPPRGSETILLAEDEAGVRKLASYILTECGYKVLEAADGNEAVRIALAHHEPIHLLITDVVMPGAGGRAVSAQIVSGHPEARVLYISGYTDDAIIRHGVLRDGVNFLQKPFSPFVLACKIREVLDSSITGKA